MDAPFRGDDLQVSSQKSLSSHLSAFVSPAYSVEAYILTWKTMLSILENDVFCAGKRRFLCWKTMFSALENDVFYFGLASENDVFYGD